MAKVSASHVYSTEAGKLWAVIGAPDAFASWHPAVAASPCGDGGRTRLCRLQDGGEIHEEITRHSDADRSYTYRVTKSPLPIANYVSTIAVEPEDGGARVVWEAEFDAVGAPPDEMERMIRGLYEAGLASLASKLS